LDNRWLKILFFVKPLFLIIIFCGLTIACKKNKSEVKSVNNTNTQKEGLVQVKNFGSNPGNLTMYRYVPKNKLTNAPLVVVLHGCTQNVNDVLHDTEWDKLAEKYGFLLVLPETKTTNNTQNCFNWFDENHQQRNAGEPLSIMQMIDNMKQNFTIDPTKIFITGLSAGAGMTAIMLATYPDVFKSGAIIAGIPYKATTTAFGASSAMMGTITKTPEQWGNLVRNAFSYVGSYPTLAIIHGIQDPIVNVKNASELIKQWTNIHQTDQIPDNTSYPFNANNDVTEYIYKNQQQQPVVVYYQINNLGHAIPVFPGTGTAQGGQTGTYSVNKAFYAPYWIGKYWGIIP
jgi:poly(hydroxyalkanoate) depolymerase family esterase